MMSARPVLLTEGNPAKRIVLFALPILAGEFLQIFYTMADAFIVARYLGINGLAAVGASYNLLCFVWGFIIGMTSGFTVITAQRAGSGDENSVRSSSAAGLILCIMAAVVLTLALIPLIFPVLALMNTPSQIINDSSAYLTVIFGGLTIFIFSNFLSGLLYAGGDSKTPFIIFLCGNIINIILDILFIAVFRLGVAGAALASVIAQFICIFPIIVFLRRRFRSFLPQRKDWRAGWPQIKEHLSFGAVMGIQRSIVEAGNIMVQTAINGLGAVTIAAVSAAQRVRGLNMMPAFAMYRAVTTYTAQNFGARKTDRVKKGLLQSSLIALCIGLFMAVLNQFTGKAIVSLFLRDSAEAISLAAQYIQITGYTVFLLGIMLVYRGVLQGLGRKTSPVISSVMETFMSVFAAFVLIPASGFLGVCLVNPLSWLASGIPLFIAYGILRKKLLK